MARIVDAGRRRTRPARRGEERMSARCGSPITLRRATVAKSRNRRPAPAPAHRRTWRRCLVHRPGQHTTSPATVTATGRRRHRLPACRLADRDRAVRLARCRAPGGRPRVGGPTPPAAQGACLPRRSADPWRRVSPPGMERHGSSAQAAAGSSCASRILGRAWAPQPPSLGAPGRRRAEAPTRGVCLQPEYPPEWGDPAGVPRFALGGVAAAARRAPQRQIQRERGRPGTRGPPCEGGTGCGTSRADARILADPSARQRFLRKSPTRSCAQVVVWE